MIPEPHPPGSILKRLIASRAGTSGIEFALTFPVIILLFLGSVTLYDVLRAYSKIVEANGIVADIVARQMTVDSAFFTKTYGAFTNLQADGSMPNALRITSVVWKDGKYAATWTYQGGTTKLLPAQVLDATKLPSVPSGDSVILVEGATQYTAIADLFGFGTITYLENAFTRPRFTAQIKN
jgi:Flp pilus assembly protein TadG